MPTFQETAKPGNYWRELRTKTHADAAGSARSGSGGGNHGMQRWGIADAVESATGLTLAETQGLVDLARKLVAGQPVVGMPVVPQWRLGKVAPAKVCREAGRKSGPVEGKVLVRVGSWCDQRFLPGLIRDVVDLREESRAGQQRDRGAVVLVRQEPRVAGQYARWAVARELWRGRERCAERDRGEA